MPVTAVTTGSTFMVLFSAGEHSVSTNDTDAAPGQGLGPGRQARCPSAASGCLVPRSAHLVEPHRGAGREPAQRTCGSALPRDPLSSPRALERRPVRAARNSARGAPVPPHVRRVSRLPPPPSVRVGCEGVDLRAVQENGSAGVGRDELGPRATGLGARFFEPRAPTPNPVTSPPPDLPPIRFPNPRPCSSTPAFRPPKTAASPSGDRKSTRLNSSHGYISYAVFCLKKKKNKKAAHTLHQSTSHTPNTAI